MTDRPGRPDRPEVARGGWNRFVCRVLRSPLHRVLFRSTVVLRYRGAKTGNTRETPVRYAGDGDGGYSVLVGAHKTKTWWKNFVGDGGHPAELLIAREWHDVRGTTIVGADDVARIAPLLAAHLLQVPKALRVLGKGDARERARRAVMVHFVPV